MRHNNSKMNKQQRTFFLFHRRYKHRVYQFLNHPRGFLAIAYQLLVVSLIFGCLLTTLIFATYDQVGYRILFVFDLIILIMFVFEFLLRLWSMTVVSKYQGWCGLVRLLSNPMYLIDLAVIAATITALIFDSRKNVISVLLRGFRMLQFFETRYQLWKLFTLAVWLQRFQLLVCLYLCLVILFLGAFIIYYLEVGHNQSIDTVASAVWFMLTTFTTVGYGDITPVTLAGKVVTGMFMLLGTAIFCLPGGVIGASLALKLNEDRSMKSNSVRRNFAANLIQNAWRVYWRSAKIDGSSFETNASSKKSGTEPGESWLHTNALTFIYLLKLNVARRKLRLSIYLCDSDTFYETYTSDTLCMNEMIRNLEVKIDRIEDRLDFEANRGDLLKSVLGDDELIQGLSLAISRRLKRDNLGMAGPSSCVRFARRRSTVLKGTSSKQETPETNQMCSNNNKQTKFVKHNKTKQIWKTFKSTRSLNSININRSSHLANDQDQKDNNFV